MQKIASSDPSAAGLAQAFVEQGLVIAYPTDTLYGFGADAENEAAVSKVYALKERSIKKDVLIAVTDLQMAGRYVIIDDRAIAIAKAFLPGPVSLVLPRSPGSKTSIGSDSSSIGIRIPNHDLAQMIIAKVGHGITSTSINKSNEPSLTTSEEIEAAFGDDLALLIEDGMHAGPPSTVVDLTAEEVKILREGVIPQAAIFEALNA